MDEVWCGLIGADPAPEGCYADGFIAGNTQAWDGVTPAYHNTDGPNHGAEPSSVVIQAQVLNLLQNNFNWPAPPPPPPQFSVTIEGQTSIAPGAQCTWWASPANYEGTLSYAWTVDGQTAGDNSDTLTYGSMNPPFTIGVTVTDDNGTAANTLYVALDASRL